MKNTPLLTILILKIMVVQKAYKMRNNKVYL